LAAGPLVLAFLARSKEGTQDLIARLRDVSSTAAGGERAICDLSQPRESARCAQLARAGAQAKRWRRLPSLVDHGVRDGPGPSGVALP